MDIILQLRLNGVRSESKPHNASGIILYDQYWAQLHCNTNISTLVRSRNYVAQYNVMQYFVPYLLQLITWSDLPHCFQGHNDIESKTN